MCKDAEVIYCTAKALDKAPPTIASRREEDGALKKWPKPRLCCANGIPETKANDGRTAEKATAPRTNPKANEVLTAPKPHTHTSYPETPHPGPFFPGPFSLHVFSLTKQKCIFLFSTHRYACQTAKWKNFVS
jgi:hypothetical protein